MAGGICRPVAFAWQLVPLTSGAWELMTTPSQVKLTVVGMPPGFVGHDGGVVPLEYV